MKIMIINDKESEKIIDFVLKRNKEYSKFNHIKLSEIIDDKKIKLENIKKTQKEFCTKLKTKLTKNKKDYILMTGNPVLKTKHGYLPIISYNFLDVIKPDIIIIMELNNIAAQVNRNYAINYSNRTGTLLQIINIEFGNIKYAVKRFNEILRTV